MTADAGHGVRPGWHDRTRVVRAPGAEHRSAGQKPDRRRQGHSRRPRRAVYTGAVQKAGQSSADQLRRQLHRRRQQRLAFDRGTCRPGVQHVAQLHFDQRPLFLHDQYRPLTPCKRADRLGLERPGHRDLEHRHVRMAIEPQAAQRMNRVVMRLAHGHDAYAGVCGTMHHPIEPVGPHPGQRRRQPLVQHTPLKLCAFRRPGQGGVEVQPMGRQRTVRCGVRAVCRHGDDAMLLGGLGDRLQRHPQPGVPRQCDPSEAKVQNVLRIGRNQHGDMHGLKDAVRRMRENAAMRGVIVARHCQHTAMPRGAKHVCAAKRVPTAVHTRALAVPHAEHAIDALTGERIDLLRAPQHRRREILIQSRLKPHAGRTEPLRLPPQLLIDTAQG